MPGGGEVLHGQGCPFGYDIDIGADIAAAQDELSFVVTE